MNDRLEERINLNMTHLCVSHVHMCGLKPEEPCFGTSTLECNACDMNDRLEERINLNMTHLCMSHVHMCGLKPRYHTLVT